MTSHAAALAFAEGYTGLSRHALLGGEPNGVESQPAGSARVSR